TQILEQGRLRVGIDEAREMNALRPGEIHIGDDILRYSLLEGGVSRINPWIRIVFTEYGHAGSDRKRSRRNRRRHNDAGVRRKIAARRIEKPASWRQAGRDRLLLDAIRRDRADLRQHVLTSVVDSPAATQDRPPVSCGVPGKAQARLKHLFLIVNRPIGWKKRIAQIRTVSRLRGIQSGIGEDLRFPAETVIERKILRRLPTVLQKQAVILVLDRGRAGRIGGRSTQCRMLEIKKHRRVGSRPARTGLAEIDPRAIPANGGPRTVSGFE